MAASAEQPMAEPRRGEFRAQSEHVERLAAKLDQAGDPEVRAAALELVQSVLELHSAALQWLIDKCLATAEGEPVLSGPISSLMAETASWSACGMASSGSSCMVPAAVVRLLRSRSRPQWKRLC